MCELYISTLQEMMSDDGIEKIAIGVGANRL
jgi:hypothetical protein